MIGKVERAAALRRLFEHQMDKTADSMPHAARQRKAAALMDELLGDAWRQAVEIPGVVVVEVAEEAPPAVYERARRALADVGEHPDAVEVPTESEAARTAAPSARDACSCIRAIRKQLAYLEAELAE